MITTPTAGRVTATQAAALTGRGIATVSLAARSGDLPFVVVNGVRRFAPADLHAWQAAKHAPPTGPLLSFSDAWRLIGYANRSSITRAIEAGRLTVVLDEHGRPRLNRADVEALAEQRRARKAKRA
ncbi:MULTISPECIES: helix-turn-helix domain-containing protein [Burkholderiaceae]|jgi:hypothetical protein|uniref:Helix-turn-helix domain-containing protein n=1 Tax=Pandoraea cepalis TaxID=2508294 RepID=A0A5E4RI59_9BURK|nr:MULTISPECIES: helix-turn-helix domain-containing protein [Burkholderiaceae]MCA7885497.1 helix-turn-helix domain-containing protein [Burkholderia contaminans]VVD61709.1 hypothetical protein PCE31106_00131 [Pandoraea cepalis]